MERSLGCNHNARGASAAVSRHRDLLHNPLAAGGAQGFASARGQFPAGSHGSAPAHALAFCRASLFPELLSHLLALLQARAFCSLRDVAPLVGARADAGLILSTPTFNPALHTTLFALCLHGRARRARCLPIRSCLTNPHGTLRKPRRVVKGPEELLAHKAVVRALEPPRPVVLVPRVRHRLQHPVVREVQRVVQRNDLVHVAPPRCRVNHRWRHKRKQRLRGSPSPEPLQLQHPAVLQEPHARIRVPPPLPRLHPAPTRPPDTPHNHGCALLRSTPHHHARRTSSSFSPQKNPPGERPRDAHAACATRHWARIWKNRRRRTWWGRQSTCPMSVQMSGLATP